MQVRWVGLAPDGSRQKELLLGGFQLIVLDHPLGRVEEGEGEGLQGLLRGLSPTLSTGALRWAIIMVRVRFGVSVRVSVRVRVRLSIRVRVRDGVRVRVSIRGRVGLRVRVGDRVRV